MSEAAQALAALAERYWRWQCDNSAFVAALAGEPSATTELFTDSIADHTRRDADAAAMLDELARIPARALDDEDAATHALLKRELDAVREQFAVRAHLRPWLLPVGPEFNTIYFANQSGINDAAGAELYLARLRSVPGFLETIGDNLREGAAQGIAYPRAVLAAAGPNLRAQSLAKPVDTAWYGPFKRTPAMADPRVAKSAADTEAVIAEAILPALARYADLIEGPLLAGARESIACTDAPDGEAYYRAFVRFFTTTDLTPEAVHDIGLSEVERIEAAMTAIAADEGADLAGYRARLNGPGSTLPDAAALRDRVAALAKRIDAKIPAMFGRIPRITYGVETMPEATARTMPPAYAQPNPADGSAPGIFWITCLPERCPTHMHVPLVLHEAWPGHLMHLAMVQEAAHLPAFRRNGSVKYTVMVEGWALYCEELGIDMGLYETPAQHFGRLEMELWRAIRLVVDTGIHALRWTREQAIAYMNSRLTLGLPTVTQEVDRYIALPAQALAYQIGNLKMRELRARAQAALGSGFQYRRFHDAIMAVGAVSLPVLEAHIDRWIAREMPERAAA